MSREEILSRVGDISQVAGIRVMELKEGWSSGLRIAEMRTGSGLRFQVSLDRGMDISMAEYRGMPLAFRSPRGDVHPRYYAAEGGGWNGTFAGGLMSGCGLNTVGTPCDDGGEALPQHGLISQMPAANVTVDARWSDDDYVMTIDGFMSEPVAQSGCLQLHREIRMRLGESEIGIVDEVRNDTGRRTPLMILYHINAGWPIVSESTRLFLHAQSSRPRDTVAAAGMADARVFSKPVPGFEEQVFYHDLVPDKHGYATALLGDDQRGMGLYTRYRCNELPRFVEWKMMRAGTYVVGIEPSNCGVEGRAVERQAGTLQFLEPGETRSFDVRIGVVDGLEQLQEFKEAHSLR